MRLIEKLLIKIILVCVILVCESESASEAHRRDPGHPQWHHGAFHDVKDSVRSDLRRMLHSRAEVPFQVPLEVNIVLIGFNGDGGYRYSIDSQNLEEFLRVGFPTHRPSCLETGELLDIEHHIVYNAFPAGQPELISLEKAVRSAMVPTGSAREIDFGREVSLYEVEATTVEPEFSKLYSYLFDIESGGDPTEEMDRTAPSAIFIVNFDKVRMDPYNKDIDLDSLMHGKINQLTEEELKKQEGDYIYQYRYNGGGSSQIWLGSGRFVVIDLSAGPCTYGKIETEEGSVSSKTLPRLRNVMYPRGPGVISEPYSPDIFFGRVASLVATTIEHVIAPDVRFETVDLTTRLLIPIIVLQNHNRYNIMERGHNYSINVEAIEAEVKKMVHNGQEVVIVGGSHLLHHHEKLAIAVSKAMRSHSLQETKKDGRFHVHTKTYLDGAILKEEMERSADVLAAGLLEVSDPSLSSKFFLRQHWADENDGSSDSVLKHKPLWATYNPKRGKDKKKKKPKQGELYRTYGTRVIPVFVLSLADVDPHLMMEDESLVWTSNDVVIVLQHQNEKIPLSYVSEIVRRQAIPAQAQRHIIAGLASVVGGVSAPYEKASHVHERPVVNWLLASGCHPFGPFSNTSQLSQMLQDVALRNTIYARVDSALHRIRDTSEAVQSFASEHLKTPLGEPVKGKKNKSSTELWLEKFYKKTTNLPEPFPHELVERLEKYLDGLEEQLVDLSSLLYDHKLQDAHLNSSEILQSSIFTQQYVDHVLISEKEKMRCCSIQYKMPVQSSQNLIYAGILLAGFFVYFVVIFFSSPVR
ncbi:Pleiotropic drug resistance protein 3 [Heracleum sosnowskyi]|uniref:Pleiotropic drug resistance protein 3 n=1 Tax=Heracleum sosnowskyi TaxID=360622 RepID=A0AAD8MW42_9APIA|nr:Pleiotropic drug resistance protein 3 [Heracleum sosnowskyi]